VYIAPIVGAIYTGNSTRHPDRHTTAGLTINDIVQALLDHPTLHVDDILREMLLHPRYPVTTMREFQALSTIARTAQDVLREVGQRCVTSMLQDQNDPTRGQVEGDITGMLGAQAARTDVPTLVDMVQLRGPFNPPVVDLATDDVTRQHLRSDVHDEGRRAACMIVTYKDERKEKQQKEQ